MSMVRCDYHMAAGFSPCHHYRYWLSREWNPDLPGVVWVMLNPSTATHTTDDPTIKRCMQFAKDWGYGSIEVRNLFNLRATNPTILKKAEDPVGQEGDVSLALCAMKPSDELVVAAWGNHGGHQNRSNDALEHFKPIDVYCLNITGAGEPTHPLYQRSDLKPQLWRPAGVV